MQDAVESKKRETMLVGLKQSKGQVGALEESLMRVQLELERLSFSLQAKTGAQPPPTCRGRALCPRPFMSTSSQFQQPDDLQTQIQSNRFLVTQQMLPTVLRTQLATLARAWLSQNCYSDGPTSRQLGGGNERKF